MTEHRGDSHIKASSEVGNFLRVHTLCKYVIENLEFKTQNNPKSKMRQISTGIFLWSPLSSPCNLYQKPDKKGKMPHRRQFITSGWLAGESGQGLKGHCFQLYFRKVHIISEVSGKIYKKSIFLPRRLTDPLVITLLRGAIICFAYLWNSSCLLVTLSPANSLECHVFTWMVIEVLFFTFSVLHFADYVWRVHPQIPSILLIFSKIPNK